MLVCVYQDKFDLVHISTGDLLREAVASNSELGSSVSSYMMDGKLVPDDIITKLLEERLASEDCKRQGWVLDGFPRTSTQAFSLKSAEIQPSHVFLLEADEDLLIERSVTRRLDPLTNRIYNLKTTLPPTSEIAARLIQRDDDTEETMRKRIESHREGASAIRERFSDILSVLDGSVHANITFTEICAIIDRNNPALHVSKTLATQLKRNRRYKFGAFAFISLSTLLGMAITCDRNFIRLLELYRDGIFSFCASVLSSLRNTNLIARYFRVLPTRKIFERFKMAAR
ncbi:adenylate kinase [Cardiosporidium cionae]|uniref:Adenylate kinase n=1 Tax=Cardiosporidium cionae TaxID=476202 RepID=A0ABQ7J9H9_9APIC|nr:adenylate kinase [Cardiosporidium cionae]|eukprot:KAF8820671.1 adenylate kinase [Cardiosporidium cionae]